MINFPSHRHERLVDNTLDRSSHHSHDYWMDGSKERRDDVISIGDRIATGYHWLRPFGPWYSELVGLIRFSKGERLRRGLRVFGLFLCEVVIWWWEEEEHLRYVGKGGRHGEEFVGHGRLMNMMMIMMMSMMIMEENLWKRLWNYGTVVGEGGIRIGNASSCS